MSRLVITRKLNESFYIDDDIIVSVMGIRGNHVRLMIEAPRSHAIWRAEVKARINQEKREKLA